MGGLLWMTGSPKSHTGPLLSLLKSCVLCSDFWKRLSHRRTVTSSDGKSDQEKLVFETIHCAGPSYSWAHFKLPILCHSHPTYALAIPPHLQLEGESCLCCDALCTVKLVPPFIYDSGPFIPYCALLPYPKVISWCDHRWPQTHYIFQTLFSCTISLHFNEYEEFRILSCCRISHEHGEESCLRERKLYLAPEYCTTLPITGNYIILAPEHEDG